MQLGLQLIPQPDQKLLSVHLLYTDVGDKNSATKILAKFTVPYTIDTFIRLQLRVTNHNVTLNGGCISTQVENVVKNPVKLIFDSGSILYIGQGGPLLNGAFEVSTSFFFFFFMLIKLLYRHKYAISTCYSEDMLQPIILCL